MADFAAQPVTDIPQRLRWTGAPRGPL